MWLLKLGIPYHYYFFIIIMINNVFYINIIRNLFLTFFFFFLFSFVFLILIYLNSYELCFSGWKYKILCQTTIFVCQECLEVFVGVSKPELWIRILLFWSDLVRILKECRIQINLKNIVWSQYGLNIKNPSKNELFLQHPVTKVIIYRIKDQFYRLLYCERKR